MADSRAATLAFAGDLESHNWEQFRDEIIAGADDDVAAVVLDLSEVTFFDSSAIRAVLGASREFEARGISLHFGPCAPIVRQVLLVTGIYDRFPPLPDTPAPTQDQ